jgi:hypothetical protein
MSGKVFTTFAEVQNALQTFANNNQLPLGSSPHGPMWARGSTVNDQYDNFVTGQVFLPNNSGGYPTTGWPILVKGSGKDSNIIKALNGDSDFKYGPMPPCGAALDQDTINAISAWIDAGANQ